MRRKIIHGSAILTAFLIVVILFLLSPPGLRVSVMLAQKLLPGKLTIEKVSGSIFSPINLSNLDYSDKNIALKIDELHLEWRLPMLLLGKLDVRSLEAKTIKIVNRTKKTTTTDDDKDNFGIRLFKVSINHANITNFSYQSNEETPIVAKQLTADNFKITKKTIAGKVKLDLIRPWEISNQMTLQGRPNNYRIELISTYANEQLKLTLMGNQKFSHLIVHNSNIYNGTIRGEVNLFWNPDFRWKANLSMHNIELSGINENLPALKNATVISSGIWQKNPVFTIDAKLYSEVNKIDIKGKYDENWNLHWSADIKNLSEFYKPYRGAIHSKGTLSGSKLKPLVKGQLQAENLQAATLFAETLNADVALDLEFQKASAINITSKHLITNGLDLEALAIRLDATENLGKITAKISATQNNQEKIQFSTKLHGKLSNNTWQGALSELNLNSSQAGDWALAAPASLTVSPDQIFLTRTCLLQNISTLCTDIDWNKTQAWQFDIKANLKNLNLITQFISPNLRLIAPTTFHLSTTGEKQQPNQLDMEFKTQSGKIVYRKDIKNYRFPIQNIVIKSHKIKEDLDSSLNITVENGDYFQAKATLANFFNPNKTEKSIDGEMQVKLSALQILESLFPVITNTQGLITGKITANGLLKEPDIKGNISISNGDINIPQIKVRLNDINLKMDAKKNQADYQLTAKTAGKLLTLTGKSLLKNKKLLTDLSLKGKDLLISNTAEYTIYASPDLRANINDHDIHISGSIDIPRAHISPADFSSTVTLPNDIEIIGGSQEQTLSEWNLLMDVNVSLGKNVKLDSYGLKGNVVGKLDITRTEEQPATVAIGSLGLKDATFKAQGQKLTISPESQINYTHDLLGNPHLDIRAYRTVTTISTSTATPIGEKTQVGVAIQGTVKNPKITLFSTPVSLSQADIISYMLLDEPATGGSSSSANLSLLIQAISSLKLTSKGDDVSLSQLKQTFRITELGIEQQTYLDGLGTPAGINQSSFVVGTRITPKIYLKYNHGLSTDLNIYRASYLFNDNWSLQLSTYYGSDSWSNGTGLDALYTVSPKHFPW
jgi:translocation and assembly module TamB